MSFHGKVLATDEFWIPVLIMFNDNGHDVVQERLFFTKL